MADPISIRLSDKMMADLDARVAKLNESIGMDTISRGDAIKQALTGYLYPPVKVPRSKPVSR